MNAIRRTSSIINVAAILVIMIGFPSWLPARTAAAESPDPSRGAGTRCSLQVDKVSPGDVELAQSFQVAIYENLLEELNKTKRFEHVFRDGDRNASDVPNVLVLRTTVEKYTAGSETRRAVTTVSGATKLTVRTQIMTRDGQIVFEREVNGNVRLFGSNLGATRNLARNIAKAIKQSRWNIG